MRGTGLTTKQIEDAPKNSVFVWCNSHTYYPKRMAVDLGREDLRVVSKYWILRADNYRGRNLEVTFDHAFYPENAREREALHHCQASINR